MLNRYDLQGNDVNDFSNDAEPGYVEISEEERSRRLNAYKTSDDTEVRVKHVFTLSNNQRFVLHLERLGISKSIDTSIDNPGDLLVGTPISYEYVYRNDDESNACFDALDNTSNGFS